MDDCDPRIKDFLNDKLQTEADLASLDDLIDSVSAQHSLLAAQLDDKKRSLAHAEQAAHDHQAQLAHRVAAFRNAQADIDGQLQAMAAEAMGEEAVPRFEAMLDTLHRLDIGHAYIELLGCVYALVSDANARLQTSPDAALGPYQQLHAFHARLTVLHDAAEGAAPQLLHHIGSVTAALRATLFNALAANLDRVLKQMRWPSPKASVPAALCHEWDSAVVRLLDLQKAELEAMSDSSRPGDEAGLPPVLLPLEVLVQPLAMRFRYHFDGDKPTNRIDRPEYFLSHVKTLLEDYSAFIIAHIQPILLRYFAGTEQALNSVCIDAMAAFITALLPMLRTKIAALLPQVAGQPQLLSHLMHEIMDFDTTIRDTWGYDGGYGVDGWKGLSWEFLVQGDWFGRWLQVEKDFALSRYQNIVDAPDFGHLDYESVDPKATKPTKGAIRVNDLLETITDRYRPLASFSQKLTFLIDIQIAIFDKLHERLLGNLEAYLSMTTSLGRAMGGVTKEEQDKLQGVQGLERLCKTYGSADFLERAMRDWSDDVFFLEIWEGLQDRARDAHKIGSMSVADVAERTSRSVDSDADGGSLFDETASWYARLRERSEKIIIDTLCSNAREALRPYRNINPWATLAHSTVTPASPSAEIDPLLAYLRSTLGFLSRALAPAPLRRITRSILSTISAVFWEHVLNRYRFSAGGAAQLHADIDAICRVVDRALDADVAEAGLCKCIEAVTLIGLPIRSGQAGTTFSEGDNGKANTDAETDAGAQSLGAWDDDDDDDDDDQPEREPQETNIPDAFRDPVAMLGLWDVEKRLFADNQSARAVLDELGLEVLRATEARALLRRRVELAG